MARYVLNLLVCWGFSISVCIGQNSIKISGCVIDDSTQMGVFNSTVRIYNADNDLLLAQLFTGVNSNCFRTTLSLKANQKLKFEIHHVSYHTQFILASVQEAQDLSILVTRNYKIMEELIVAPSKWKIGDTTFHNVDNYKEGDEKNLIDLLKKMPGFKLDDQGNLYYNYKKVNSILIEGTELFTDRTQTLINNFPIHLLKNIQAIENQTKNKVLKGLGNTSETQINLSLNKEKRISLFGNIDGGGGNEERYEVKNTIFSLLAKIKSGIITNINSMGNTYTSYMNDYIYNNKAAGAYSSWTNTQPSFNNIPNFEPKRYIKNHEQVLQFETNVNLTKHIKQKIEFSFLKTNQKQAFNNYEIQVTDGGFISSLDTSFYNINPYNYYVKQELSWENDKTDISFKQEYNHFSLLNNSYRNRVFNQNTANQLDSGKIKSNIAEWNLNIIKRLNTNQAISFSGNFLINKITNQSLSKSDVYKNLQPEFDAIFIQPNFNISSGFIAAEFINKNKKNKKWMPKLQADFSTIDMSNQSYLGKYPHGNQKYLLENISQNGKYASLLVYQKSDITFPLKKYTVQTAYHFGLSKLSKYENIKHDFYHPYYYASVDWISKNTSSKFPRINMVLNNDVVSLSSLPSIYYTSATNQFQSGTAGFVPIPKLRLSVMSFKLFTPKKAGNTNSFLLTYNHAFKSNVYTSMIENTFIFSRDSIIKNNSSAVSFNFEMQQVVMPLSSLLNFKIFYRWGNQYSYTLSKVLNNKTSQINTELSLKRSWNKVYQIKLMSNASLNLTHTSLKQFHTGFNKQVLNIKNTLAQKLIINKQLNLILTAENYTNNIFTGYKNTFTFLELKGHYNVSPKLNMGILFSNITNVKSYQYFINTPLMQSFSNIPLIPRSIFITVGYNF